MIEFFRQLLNGVAQTWRRLSISARVQLGLAALLTLAVVAGAALFGAQPQYGLLFRNLPADEASQISVWLTEQDIQFRMREGGTAIDVPARDISRARLGLAGISLPTSQGSVPGFEIFDKRDLMSNRFLQDVDYMRGLRGELQKQVDQFDFVKAASVFIREAPDDLFIGEQKPSEATVLLKTSGPLTPMQVGAVLQTVDSFGGANLSKRNISIMDTDGNVLHSATEDEFASLANDKLSVKVAYEKEAEKKIKDAFREMKQNVVVKVNATLDWTSEEITDTKKAEGQVVATMVSTDTVREADAEIGGAPGATANIPEELGAANKKNFLTESKETIENSEPSETLRKKSVPPGILKKYSVAAIVDLGYEDVLGADGQPAVDAAGKPQRRPKPETPELMASYKTFIESALGGSDAAAAPAAGGGAAAAAALGGSSAVVTEVTVAAMAFGDDAPGTGAPEVTAATPWTEAPWFNWTWRIGLVGFMFLLVRFLMRRALVIPTTEEEEEVLEIPAASPAERRAQEIAAEVERLSQQEPDTVAALLRTWMSEE